MEHCDFCSVITTIRKYISDDRNVNQIDLLLVSMKLKNNLRPYVTEIEPLYNFSEKKIVIRDNVYPLYVFTLQKINETDYEANIKL